MKTLRGIASFVDVANTGSLTAASKLQGVSAVAVGKSLATLERQMGVRLIQRTTRKLSLTAEGQAFLKQVLGPLREIEAAQANVQASTKSLSGVVRITSVPPIARGYLLPIIAKFHAINPKVQVELHFDDGVADMVAQGYDIGIRVGQLTSDNLIARPLSKLPFVLCASTQYLAFNGEPKNIQDLFNHNCLRLRRNGQNLPMPWLIAGADSDFESRLGGNLLINDFAALLTAAELGQGICCLPLPMVLPFFRSGRLRPVLAHSVEGKLTLFLHFPSRKNLPARTRALIDFIVEHLQKEPDLQSSPAQLLAPFVL
jgi:DNA-binding transcriptional LysR family regulator